MRQYRLVLVGVALAAALALGFLYVESSILPLVSTSLSGAPDPNAVRLYVSLNANPIAQGQKLIVTITLLNTLPRSNNLPLVEDWPVKNMSSGPCGGLYPLGIAVYNASGSSVEIFNEFSLYNCPASFVRTTFHLGPLDNITRSVELDGYWTPGTRSVDGGISMGIPHPFSPSTYTVFAGDIWGHVVATYFTVVSS